MMLGPLNLLSGTTADLYPFERCILGAVKIRLNAEGAAKLQRQIEVINKIQWLSDGKEVNLYQMRRGKPAFDDNARFLNAAGEELLASAKLIGLDKRSKLKV